MCPSATRTRSVTSRFSPSCMTTDHPGQPECRPERTNGWPALVSKHRGVGLRGRESCPPRLAIDASDCFHLELPTDPALLHVNPGHDPGDALVRAERGRRVGAD